jgi:hypothetical protein
LAAMSASSTGLLAPTTLSLAKFSMILSSDGALQCTLEPVIERAQAAIKILAG